MVPRRSAEAGAVLISDEDEEFAILVDVLLLGNAGDRGAQVRVRDVNDAHGLQVMRGRGMLRDVNQVRDFGVSELFGGELANAAVRLGHVVPPKFFCG